MLSQRQKKLLKKIKSTAGDNDLLHPIEREWVSSFEIKFGPDGGPEPCMMSDNILTEMHKKATDPKWKPPWVTSCG